MDQGKIESEIRRLLREEPHAEHLSNKLFSPGGLFAQLAPTKEQRKQLAETELFAAAQSRVSELERQDAAECSETVKKHAASRESAQAALRAEQSPIA